MRETQAGGGLMANSFIGPLESLFWPDGFSNDMWMVVDGARDPSIYSSLVNSYLQYSCLYAGELPLALTRAAPYLVHLAFEDLYTRRLIERAWGTAGASSSAATRTQNDCAGTCGSSCE